jgi:hypothetical protein
MIGLRHASISVRCQEHHRDSRICRWSVLEAEPGGDEPDLDFAQAPPPEVRDLSEPMLAAELEDIARSLGRVKGRAVSAVESIEGHQGQDGLQAVDRAAERDRVRAVKIAGNLLVHAYRTLPKRERFSTGEGEKCRNVPSFPSYAPVSIPAAGNM